MVDFQAESERWRELGKAEPKRLKDARVNLHWAVQVVAAVGATYSPPQPDDSHTNLEWLGAHGVLAGTLIDWKRPFRVALRPYDLMLQVRDADASVIVENSLQGQTYSDGIAWVGEQVNSLADQKPARSISRPDYELPDHEIARGGKFATDTFLLKELTLWFSNADLVLRGLENRLENVSPVRCWPHHFDIAVLIDQGDERTIGIGMEPGDSYYDQPYWYVRPYPPPQKSDLPQLAGGGIWHRTEWLGAVLPGTELVKATPGDQQCRQLGEFIDSAIIACRNLMAVA